MPVSEALPNSGTTIDILGVDLFDAILLEGVLAVLEHDTRAAADRKEALGHAESATLIGNRAMRWRRVRVALERAVYPAKDRRLSGIEQYQAEGR